MRTTERSKRRRWSSERGAMVITALGTALLVAGLSIGLLGEGLASQRMFKRSEENLRALEAAETGIARAEEEISAQIDTGTDGVGNLEGDLYGSSFQVTAVQDPVNGSRWTLTGIGCHGLARRTLRVGLQRSNPGPWGYGLFAKQTITMSGGATTTDSFDSRKGSYASQATNVDALGAYANQKGSIGTNAGAISISGNARVRGNATPGPSYAVSLSGTSTVVGSQTPLTQQIDLPPTPLATFQAALASNDNGSWTTTGGTTWNATTKALTVSAGDTITLTGSTYFFSNLTLSGGSILRITRPRTKVYVTGNADFSGGSVSNTSGQAINFQLYAYPYALPSGFNPPSNPSVKLSGGSGSAYAVYAPAASVTISGSSGVYGAVIGKTITPSGGSRIHYDEALGDLLGGNGSVQRLYWYDAAVPLR